MKLQDSKTTVIIAIDPTDSFSRVPLSPRIYSQALHQLIPLPARPQETLIELVARVEQAAVKRREVEKAQAKLAKEKQFNRKVAINARLRQLKNELEELIGRGRNEGPER